MYCNNDTRKAKDLLEKELMQVKPVSLIKISFYAGVLLGLVIMNLYITILPNIGVNNYSLEIIKTTYPVFRGVFIISFSCILAGIAVTLFKQYRVNYIYILEVDPKNRF